MKKQLQILLTAFVFYTRLPIGKLVKHDPDYLENSIRYLPVVGWLVGGASAGIYILTSYSFSPIITVVLSMVTGVVLTGGFHEDGFADVCDGFGGGWTKDKILTIMKDSQIGVFGAIGLVLLFLLKGALLFDLFASMGAMQIILFSIVAQTMSRFVASTFLITHTYARLDKDSKVGGVTKGNHQKNIGIGAFLCFLPLLAYGVSFSYWVMAMVIPVYFIKIILGRYFTKWIGGYTGDCLGATQQISEIVFYMGWIVLWKYI